MDRLVHDWPAYLFMGAFIWFLLYISISSRRNKNKNRDTQGIGK